MAGRWVPYGWLLGLSLVAAGCGSSKHSDDDDSAAGAGTAGDAGASAANGGKGGRGSTGGSGGDATGGTSAGTGGDGGGGTNGGTGGTSGTTGGGTTGGTGGSTGGTSNMTAGQTGTLPSEPAGFFPVGQGDARDKLDLLLMIDNSLSMFQKQALLAESVPWLMRRLTQPDCVLDTGVPTGGHSDVYGACPDGEPEFPPVRDLHLGIITSSLGDHGSGDVCSDARAATAGAFYNDRAELLPKVRTSLRSWNDTGFLVWDPRDQSAVDDPHTPIGSQETNLGDFTDALVDQVSSVGENGCGYEGSLEAWYRFLIDPEPVGSMSKDTATALSVRGATNTALLAQRAAFLRPDSAVAIVMMSDENDCSVRDEDGSQGWVVAYSRTSDSGPAWHMPRGTSACEADPNDRCCVPCLSTAPSGCTPPASDSACAVGVNLETPEDSVSLRCFEQKRRFGVDLLYPTNRYVEALTSPTVLARPGGPATPNPLYASGERDPSSVVLMGILGVPWQDISTEASWSDPRGLSYLRAAELVREGRWSVILGDETTNGVPKDTLMVESIDPRLAPLPQAHPLLPDVQIGSPEATTNTNPINGHEETPLEIRDELQFACIFPLPAPVPCTTENANGCDCNYDEAPRKSPLCIGATDTTDGTQIAAKAQPSRRQLDVLRGIGAQGVVTSICPKNPSTSLLEDPDYAYNPAFTALLQRLKLALAPSCLIDALSVSDTEPGGTRCHLLELEPGTSDTCDCAALGRISPSSDDLGRATQHLRARGTCTDAASCSRQCVCEIPGLEGDALERCRNDDGVDDGDSGFCYVDTDLGTGSAELVSGCPAGQKRIVRFVGAGTPREGASVFASCDN